MISDAEKAATPGACERCGATDREIAPAVQAGGALLCVECLNGSGPSEEADGTIEHLTDLGNTRRFVRQHRGRIRYCPAWKQWLHFDGNRWQRDLDGEIERCAKATVATIYGEAADPELGEKERKRIADHAKQSESEARIRAMLSLARSEPGVPVSPERLDAEPFLLACANGTIDLRTGKLRPSDSADLLTRGTTLAYDPEARCPRWLRFLEEVFDGDRELIEFIWRWIGYNLTGLTIEEVLAVLHGSGRNGKTTLKEIVLRLLGDLATVAPFAAFIRVRDDRRPRDDLARLHGARMVAAAEAGKGRRLDEATLKEITGSDTISARELYAKAFDFRPTFKIWLITNHRPRVDGGDEAIWARLRLIPFEVSFKGREDKRLEEKLRAELPGILRWAVEGCLRWQQEGLGTAQAVEVATAEYRKDEDAIGAFLAERCTMEGEADPEALRQSYERYCQQVGEEPLAPNLFGRELADRGIRRVGKGRRYQGVSLQ